MLREKDVVVSDEKALTTLMNNYFVNITADLDLKRDRENLYDTPASVYNMKKKFQDHQSILKIKKAFNVTDLCSFHEITEDEIRKKNLKLDGSKATPVGNIPAEMLKSTIDVHVSLLTKIINSSIRNGCFPDKLKAAEVTPTFKKNDDLGKKAIGLSVFCLMCQRSLKGSCIFKLKISWKASYQNCLQVSGKTIAPNIV